MQYNFKSGAVMMYGRHESSDIRIVIISESTVGVSVSPNIVHQIHRELIFLKKSNSRDLQWSTDDGYTYKIKFDRISDNVNALTFESCDTMNVSKLVVVIVDDDELSYLTNEVFC